MATREELLRQRHERELEKVEQLQKKAKQTERVLALLKRKRENRRKYIVGGHILDALTFDGAQAKERLQQLIRIFSQDAERSSQTVFEALKAALDKTLVTDQDRLAFDLKPLPKQRKSKKGRRTQQEIDAARIKETTETQPTPAKSTSLPPSLIEATIVPPSRSDAVAEDIVVGNREQRPPRPLPQSNTALEEHFNGF